MEGLILSGPPGSGKSTLASALAAGIPNCALLQTDWFYAAIKTGSVEPWLPAAERQNHAVVSAAASAAVEYARGGYFVVLDGVVLQWAREIYDAAMRSAGFEVAFLVLLPRADETVRRGMSRGENHGLTPQVYAEMHRQFVTADFQPDEVIDSTDLSLQELVAAARRRIGLDPAPPLT